MNLDRGLKYQNKVPNDFNRKRFRNDDSTLLVKPISQSFLLHSCVL